jgi:hypothetical protein
VEGVDGGLDDVGGRVKIGLPDFQVNDFFALFLQGTRAVQDFEGGFGAQTRHSGGETQFRLGSGGHGSEIIPFKGAINLLAIWSGLTWGSKDGGQKYG